MKVFIFFGGDLGENPIAVLDQMKCSGYHLLPIDATAIGLAMQSRADFSLLDDWVDAEEIEILRAKADEDEVAWYSEVREFFVTDNVVWPEIDRRAMMWFWREVLLAEKLACVFQERNVDEVCFCQHAELRPSFYFGRSDGWSQVLRYLLGSKANVLPIIESKKQSSALAHILQLFSKWARSNIKSLMAATGLPSLIPRAEHREAGRLKDKSVLVFYIPERYRLQPVAEQLRQYRRDKAAAVVFNANHKFVSKLEQEWGFPVLHSLKPYILSPVLSAKFRKGYLLAKEQWLSKRFSPDLLRALDFHFEYYYRERWPMLATWLKIWIKLWKKAQPETILVTTLDYTEAQLPAAAADAVGIPTASVPHAVVAVGKEITLSSRFMFHCLPLLKNFGDKVKLVKERLIPCRDLLTRLEYEPHRLKDSTPRIGPWRILVLCDPCSTPGMLMPHAITYGIQFQALRILANPPDDIRSHLSLHIKPHPGYPAEADLYKEFGGKIWEVVPPKVSLFDELEKCDLVIGLNYYGSAIAHVLTEEKPMIFLQTQPKGVEALGSVVYKGAGEVVSTEKEFWSAIRSFFTCPEYVERIRSINQEFRQCYLVANDYPDISHSIDMMLEKSPTMPKFLLPGQYK